MVLARRAGACGVERAEIARELRVAHVHAAGRRERRAHAGRACGQHAVEHVHALAHRAHQRGGVAHAHQVARTILGARAGHVAQRLEHHLVVLAHRVAADAEAAETAPACGQALVLDLAQAADGLKPQIQLHAALHDAEQRLVGTLVRGQAAARPVGRQVHGLRHERLLGRVRRALVQLHGDVGAQLLLDGHVALGRPTHLRAVVDGAEREALVVQLERVGQAEHLEPARVSEHGAVVVHEAVHAAGFGHHVGAGAQRQVVRVGQHHLAVQVAQLARGDALHRGAGAHRHEHGRLERSVRGLVGQRTGMPAGRLDLAVEQRHG